MRALSNVNEFMDEKMLELFFADTKEMLEASIDDVLELENGYDRERLDNIMRTMHSIKGGSAMLEMTDVEHFSHKLEDYFIKLRDGEIKINVEWIDDMIEGVNILKKWIEKREGIFKSKGEFNAPISEEKNEFESLVAKIIKEKVTEKNVEKKFVSEETYKEVKKNELKIKGEKGYYRVEVYFDESAPMFEIKRTIIKRELEEIGEIIESNPLTDELMDNSINYYKFIIKSEKDKEAVLKCADTTDVYFVSIAEEEASLENENVELEVYLKKDAKLESINFIYENIIQMIKEGRIKKIYKGTRKVDIYGAQIFELLKKEQNTEVV